MNSYDRVLAIFNQDRDGIDRIPCVNPVSTATIDFMKSYDAYWPDSHKDPEKMAKLASAAHRLCGLDNITVPFDMLVEAELLGIEVEYHEEKIKWPSIKSFKIKDVSDLKISRDVAHEGRIPIITKALKILKEEFEGKVPINAYIAPPFTSISSYMLDTSTFLLWTKIKPEKIHEICKAAFDVYAEIVEIYGEAGADIITFHEMGGGADLISPKDFDRFVKPYLSGVIDKAKPPRILSICGSADVILEKMIECGAEAIALDERTPLKLARETVDKIKPNYPILGNISSRGIIHSGSIDKIREVVKKTIEGGIDMVAPGCDFWIETPTDNIKALVESTIEFGSPPPWKK
jgi:[methyl-Co(III) methanol-specific corrinoid protein]:coenzyme M methyltransferase